MKVVIGLILFCALCRAVEIPEQNESSVYDYHRRYGIPMAAKIRKLETDITPAENRIVGGGSTTTFSVPYQVGLIITIWVIYTSVCGGTLISDSRVLTAGHCYNDGNNVAQSFTVVLGSNLLFSGGTRITTNDFVLQPGYNPGIIANDLGIIRISRVSFSLQIQPINLPSGTELNLDYVGYTAIASGYGATRDVQIQPINLPSGTELNLDYVGYTAIASGYGATRDGDSVGLLQTINSVNLRVITNNECSLFYSGLQHTHLCTSGAGGVGVCLGDTGGPLVTTVNGRRILIGISSFVSRNGCQAGQPSGFTRVSAFTAWIHSI